MDISFLDVFVLAVVLESSEPSQAILKHIDSQRIIAGNHNVDSQIIF